MRAGVVLILLLVSIVPCSRASDRLELDGYFKSFFVAYKLPSVSFDRDQLDLPTLGSVANRVRLNARLNLLSKLSFAASYDFAPRVQDHLLFAQTLTASPIDPYGYRFDDIRGRIYPSPCKEVASFAVYQNLDRAFFELRTERADLFVGRQPIAWGSARTVNPTDILAPYTYEALDTEDRVGVDAIRARIPLGFMSELDAGYVFGRDFEFANSAMFLRGKFYLAETDISLIALGYRENLMFGVDLARSVGGAGVWLEAAHTSADALAESDSEQGEDFLRATAGVDFSLAGDDYLFIEYHLNHAGADDPRDYLPNLRHTAYTEGATYLLGRHYLIPGASFQVTPLITASLETLWNLSDCSAYVTPGLEYNVAENVFLSIGAFVGLGKEPELVSGVRSEFGGYPNMYYSTFRVYF